MSDTMAGQRQRVIRCTRNVVQGMLQRLYDEGQIYKDKQAGYYSVRQEQFLTDKERGPDGEFGPEWGQVEYREEENYYFRLASTKIGCFSISTIEQTRHSRFSSDRTAQRGREISDNASRRPLHLASEIAARAGESNCRSISDFVNYVWFDALTNYISFIGYDPT